MIKNKMVKNIVFYDGVCKFCNKLVIFLINIDRKKKIYFASQQGDFARNFLKAKKIDAEKLEALHYVSEYNSENEKFYSKSSAFLNILKEIGGIWKLPYVFIVVPKQIRDLVYNSFSKIRYRLFGKYNECKVPDDNIKSRFID